MIMEAGWFCSNAESWWAKACQRAARCADPLGQPTCALCTQHLRSIAQFDLAARQPIDAADDSDLAVGCGGAEARGCRFESGGDVLGRPADGLGGGARVLILAGDRESDT